MTPPRDFDDLLAQFAPQRWLHDPRATGEGIRVAVIDSGIERAVLEDRFAGRGQTIARIEGAVFRSGSPTPLPYDGHQSSPHGTTVADIILGLAPKATLFSADVFGPQGSCEVETVIAGLRLLEAVRALAVRHGTPAVDHCLTLIESLKTLLDATHG